MTPEATLVWVMVGFWVISVSMVIPFVVWALKNGQFRDQERARYLALDTTPPSGTPEAKSDGV